MDDQRPLIIDAHLDISMNAMEWNRDLTLPVQEIREREKGLTDKLDRAKGVMSLPALREGRIGLVVATQIARFVARDSDLPGWHSPAQAWAQSQGQLAWYKTMEKLGEMIQITNLTELNNHIDMWEDRSIADETKPIGFILSLEGADSLVNLDFLDTAHQYGLRALGPAHYGPGRYANGTGRDEALGEAGIALLKKMDSLNLILDVTHLTDAAFDQAMDIYTGPVWASHHNSRTLVPHQRQLTDEQIKTLIERDAVIGASLDVWMMVPGWVRGQSDPFKDGAALEVIVDHWDHICQIAGNANHIAIGSDLDGMFGKEQSPYDLETIADLQKLPEILSKRGYAAEDIEKIMHGNWLRLLRRAWA